MLVSSHEAAADRRPALVICTFDPAEHDWDLVEDLSGTLWSPPGARTVQIEADAAATTASDLTARLNEDGRAVLLVGRSRRSAGFQIQMRAENRRADGQRLDPTGPGVARSTAPVAEMVEALRDIGLAATASSDCEDDIGNEIMYRVLTALPDGPDSPAIGLFRAPADASGETVQKAVKAAAVAMTRHLGAAPRQRFVS